MLYPIVHRSNVGDMDILAQVLDRVRLGGTLLFHFELGHPWHLELPARPYALFHYLSQGSATLALGQGPEIQMTEGDFVVITRGEPHVFYSDRRAKPLRIIDIDRSSPHLGVVRHGSRAKLPSAMICGNFTVSRPLFGSVLELLPPVLLLKPTADGGWLEAILRRMISESALERPGQRVALSRLTEVLFVEVLRSWIASLRPGQGGWLGAISDPHIGPALKLIHENPEFPWTLSDLGQRVGLGRSVFSARFTKLLGQSMHRYVIEVGWRKRRTCWKLAMSPSHVSPAGLVTRQLRRFRSCSIDITAYHLAGTEHPDALTAAKGKGTFGKQRSPISLVAATPRRVRLMARLCRPGLDVS
jgi:cupin